MKKVLIGCIIVFIMLTVGMLCIPQDVYATADNSTNALTAEQTSGELTDIKEQAAQELKDYTERYGSDTYGLTAYILNKVRIYSIPFCFLGIAISAIYQYVIGIRKLDTQEKGLVMMVSFITILVICQILPLAFAIVVKFGRG